jgi:Ca2+-binding RTX toxin-like protein
VLAYLNDGNNRFYQMSPKVLMDYAGLSLTVMDVDNDGKKELVQVGSSNGTYGVQIVHTVTTGGNVAGSGAKDTVFGDDGSQTIDGRGGADFLAGGGGNDVLLGGAGNDKLLGGGGNDILNGGAGKDILVGGRGADTLTGGAGADMFVFSSRHDSSVKNPDVIKDFSRNQGDRIDLQAIDANTKSAGDQAFKFIGTDGFHKKAGELRYEKKSGDTFVFADVNGDGKADFSIRIDASMNLKASDFIL